MAISDCHNFPFLLYMYLCPEYANPILTHMYSLPLCRVGDQQRTLVVVPPSSTIRNSRPVPFPNTIVTLDHSIDSLSNSSVNTISTITRRLGTKLQSVSSLQSRCFVVLLQKFQLPIGVHSSCSIRPTAGRTCQKCFIKDHD